MVAISLSPALIRSIPGHDARVFVADVGDHVEQDVVLLHVGVRVVQPAAVLFDFNMCVYGSAHDDILLFAV